MNAFDVDDLNSASAILRQFAKKNNRVMKIFQNSSDDDSNSQVKS